MTPEQTEALIRRLGRMNDAVKANRQVFLPEGSVTRLDLIGRRLVDAVKRANTPGPEHDGYPSGHRGGGSGDPDSIDYHPDSSTQHHAFQRVAGKPKDPVHEHVALAYRHLETAVNELAALTLQLDYIDEKLSTPYRHTNMPSSCLACDRTVEGTSVDRLRRGMCHTCYVAWGRAGKPDIMAFRRTRGEQAA